MSTCTLIANDLKKSFQNGKLLTQVLDGVSVSITSGELTLVSGPSGCGKSTLLAILSGLLKPDFGSVHALGNDIWMLEAEALEKFRLLHTGFIFQGFNLFPALTALDQVALPLTYLGFSNPAARKRATDALEEVGMGERATYLPLQLSGGEKQRVAIARAIAKTPALLFADEPTSALDAENGRLVIDTLRRIANKHNTMVLCVSHDPRVLDRVDRVIQMEDGRILNDLGMSGNCSNNGGV